MGLFLFGRFQHIRRQGFSDPGFGRRFYYEKTVYGSIHGSIDGSVPRGLRCIIHAISHYGSGTGGDEG